MIDKTPFSENMISVSEVNATIKACMDAPIFKGLQVFGEVSGYKLSGPHAYFTLKDKLSQISCVCFYAAKTYMPKDGESVIVNGGLDYYVKGGRLSLQASSITPVGQGLLFLEFERLKAKLLAEGLFDEAHKIAIPAYSQNVCVITSKTGAVIRDIVTTIRRQRCPCSR
ncbi:MAG: exodeoxyribonuclease VII large subunit [Clostridia bacterium]